MNPKIIPALGVNEGLDFVKRVWGSLPLPSVITPTTDVEELDKRISDLRAVEQWLNVNLSMLRATIQGLEVQRGTIATLKSFGSNIGVTKAAPEAEKKSESGFSDALGNLGAGLVGAVGAIAAGQSSVQSAMQAAQQAAGAGAASPLGGAQAAPAAGLPPVGGLPGGADAAADPVANALLANASSWWGVLQDQFNRVAGAAMSGAGLAAGVGEADASAPKSKPKRTVSASKATKPARSSSAIMSKAGKALSKPLSKSRTRKTGKT